MGKPWSADFVITEELVRQLVSVQFPKVRISQIQHFASGWDNELFEINSQLIFRFPRRQIAADLVNMENSLLPALVPLLPLPIPSPSYAGEKTTKFPYPFSGYRKLEGFVPYKLALNDSIRSQSAELWARFLKKLHQVNVTDAVNWGAKPIDEIGRMNMAQRKPRYIERLEEAYNKGLVGDIDRLFQVIDDLPGDKEIEPHKALVHGDLNFRNFLTDDEGVLCCVLDWGDAHIGHPAVDLSIVYSFLPESSRECFFNIYGPVSPQTKQLSRFRAIYTNLTILLYAYDIGDSSQMSEAKRALKLSCET